MGNNMSASEKLRALIDAAEVPKHGEETWEKKMAWDRYNEAYFALERLMRPDAALPQIVAVVEAAESECATKENTPQNQRGGVMYWAQQADHPIPGVQRRIEMARALSALKDALS